MFTFDSELRHILTQLCKRPTMRFKQYEKATLLKYEHNHVATKKLS